VQYTAPQTKTRDDVQKDTTECEAGIAVHSTAVAAGTRAGALSAVATGAWWALEGAAIGAMHGGARGAADGSWIGAAAGVFVGLVVGVVTGVQRSSQERQPYEELYRSCLRDRGNAIAGESPPVSSPPTEVTPGASPTEPAGDAPVSKP
jgi:hypothetical protein